ncbi:MAG: hypothetical protein IH852_03425 [Bacteroidetes bacterium]|nr:hypothetical protein [Bacteroidota bacterium]
MLQWFDTLMGLVVILLAVSLVIMILNQIIVALLNLRGNNLKKGIKLLLENSDVDLKVYAEKISSKVLSHPLISDKWRKSGYWSLATTIRPNELIKILNVIADSGEDDWQVKLKKCLSEITDNIENWFDNIMDRVTQSFVRQTRFWTIIFSLIVAFALHLDAFRLFEQISNDAELRASLIASSDTILKQTEEVIGKASLIPMVYKKAILQLKLQDTTGTASELRPPPAFVSREDGENWLREQLAGNEQIELLINQYGKLIDSNLTNSVERLRDRAISIKSELDKTKLQLIPQPYPGWNYSPGDIHFWGVLVMAAFLSLGAPFWFKALKTMSALRPILAEKEEKERKNHKEKL